MRHARIAGKAHRILCAFGLLVSDLRHDLLETHVRALQGFSFEQAQPILERLSGSTQQLLERDAVPAERRLIELKADLRYVGQSYELSVPIEPATAEGWAGLAMRFHEAHRQRFGHADERAPIETVTLAATGWGRVEPPRLPSLPPGGPSAEQARVGVRPVFFEPEAVGVRGSWHDTTLYERSRLRAGNVVHGPAVIDEVSRCYSDRPQDRMDGLTVDCGDWWFNLRPSNTEPLLRLNLEAPTREECDDHVAELLLAITSV